MIEAYKSKIKDLELTIDVLKVELGRKGEMTPEEVSDFIIRKTISGPKRFRPQTREEMEKSIAELERKFKRASNIANNVVSASGNDNRSVAGSVAGSVRSGTRGTVASSTRVPETIGTIGESNRVFSTNSPSRIEDVTQIANLTHELTAIKVNVD